MKNSQFLFFTVFIPFERLTNMSITTEVIKQPNAPMADVDIKMSNGKTRYNYLIVISISQISNKSQGSFLYA